MILINQNHIDKFKFFNGCYNYYVSNGVWLMFNKKSLEYEGCYCFFEKRYMNKVYACSDLHGMYNLWKQIKEYCDETDTIYYLLQHHCDPCRGSRRGIISGSH